MYKKLLSILLLLCLVANIFTGVNVYASDSDNHISIRVEGINNNIVRTDSDYTTQKSTVYDALCELLQKENIPIVASDSQYGKYIASIDNETAGTFGGYDGWLYAVNGVEGSTSMDSCNIHNDDSILVYYGGYSPQTYIPKVSLSGAEVTAGATFTVSITATYFDWNTSNNETIIVTGAAIKLLDQTYTTDENGQAVITAPAVAGDYTLEISRNRSNNYPLLVRTTQAIKVVAAPRNLELDKAEANLGDTVTFTVYSSDAANVNKPYEVYFLDKDGNTFTSDKLWSPELNDYYSDTVYAYGALDQNGKNTAEFIIPSDINTGEYNFRVYFYGTGKNITSDLKLTVKAPEVNKSSLEAAISAANSNKASAAVSLDGSDIEVSQKWVNQEIMTSYGAAIEAAKGIFNKADAAQSEVNQAVANLGTATGKFNDAKKDGTKQAAYIVTFNAGENGTLAAAVDGAAINTGSIVEKGKSVVFTASPAKGYKVKEWTTDNTVVLGNKTTVLTVANIQAAKAVTVVFEKIPSTISFPVDRQTIVKSLDKATDKLIEKFDDENFNYQKHWMAIAIHGLGKKVPGSYLNDIKNGDMPAKNSGQYGKYILGILAAGGDPENINGRNLMAELCQLSDMKNVNTEGGIYTTPFGLLALDAVNYQIPADAGFTRDDIINKLITLASPTGGEDGAGFVLTALGKYYKEKPAVKTAVDKVVSAWAKRQGEDGGFGAGAWSTENNVNTAAQVLMGLCFNGIDPQSEQFTKEKGNAVSFILNLQKEDGTFNWQKSNEGSISMATEQAVYALDQYLRQLDGKKSIYDFTEKTPDVPDITAPMISTDLADKSVNACIFAFTASANDATEGPVVPVVKLGGNVVEGTKGIYRVNLSEGSNTITVSAADTSGNKSEKSFTIVYAAKTQGLPAGDKPKVEIPADNNDYKIPINIGDNNKEITIEIPDSNAARVFAELPPNSSLPEILVVKGKVTALFPKGIQVISGNTSQIELITSKDTNDTAIKNKINDTIPAGKKLDSIVQAFTMGGSEGLKFDGYVILTFKGMQGKEAAYIQSGTLHPIQKYANDSAGIASNKNEYAYDSGSDLIVKTNHFTDYIVYSASTVQAPENGSGTTPQTKKYITLSVDKLTINKGYVISSKQVELQPGDTAWTLLKRELNNCGISNKYIWSEQYGSVYVQSIDGDGEFDHGSGSGWMYAVNGWYPNYGATKYTLKDGDKLQWRYTTNLGADLGEDLGKWQNGNSSNGNTSAGNTPSANTSGSQETSDNKTGTVKIPENNQKAESKTIDLKNVYSDTAFISAWAYKAVEETTQKGFVSGSNGKFNPNANITRAEFIKIIVSALGLDTNINKVAGFADVTEKDWFYPYLNAAYKAGIIKGSGGSFKPGDKITREQMAVIIVNALKLEASKQAAVIKDISEVSGWAKAEVNSVAAKGFMVGDSNSCFNPKNSVTREMAVVVAMKVHFYKNGKSTGNDEIKKAESKNTEVKKYIEETGALMQKTVSNPVVGSIGGEWTVLSLARSGINISDSYYARYYSNVEKKLKETSGKLHNVKYTEYDRVILALGSIGKDITNVNGYNLTKPLADFNTVIKQGLNGPVWALIALDSKGYQIPVDNNVSVQTTREKLIDYILSKEIKGGGWSLTSEAPADTDITAMALQALSKYRDNEKAEAAIGRALGYLSAAQQEDGSFKSTWGNEASSESIAQVIVALTSLKIDPKKDNRFIKNGKDTITALLAFYTDGGGFKHTLKGELDGMATDQGMYALVAYKRFTAGQKPLYDMSDIIK